jgi:hypothetical protein
MCQLKYVENIAQCVEITSEITISTGPSILHTLTKLPVQQSKHQNQVRENLTLNIGTVDKF